MVRSRDLSLKFSKITILSWFIYDPTDLKVNMQFEMKYCFNDKRTHAVREIKDKITAQIIIQIIQFDRF